MSINSPNVTRQYQVNFKCNKCSTEWTALNKDSHCLKCDGKGRTIAFKANSDSSNLKQNSTLSVLDISNKLNNLKLQDLKCDENGQNITEKQLTNIKIKPKKKSNNKVAFRCNKCFFEWSANEKESQCLKCDGKGVNIPIKRLAKTKPKQQSTNMVAFKCNKCLIEWKANQKESQCLECDGKGNNIRLRTFNKKLAAFRCNKCSNEWEAIKTNSQCPNCDGRGYNIRKLKDNELREFACKKCHDKKKYSWFVVTYWSDQLKYSCDKCKSILNPLPKEEEFGTCRFLCPNCQNQFYGFGSKSPKLNLKSRCYDCNHMIEPNEVIPKKGDIVPRTKKMHSCSKCEGSKNCPFKGKCLAFSRID